jgi:hypothetical protein
LLEFEEHGISASPKSRLNLDPAVRRWQLMMLYVGKPVMPSARVFVRLGPVETQTPLGRWPSVGRCRHHTKNANRSSLPQSSVRHVHALRWTRQPRERCMLPRTSFESLACSRCALLHGRVQRDIPFLPRARSILRHPRTTQKTPLKAKTCPRTREDITSLWIPSKKLKGSGNGACGL